MACVFCCGGGGRALKAPEEGRKSGKSGGHGGLYNSLKAHHSETSEGDNEESHSSDRKSQAKKAKSDIADLDKRAAAIACKCFKYPAHASKGLLHFVDKPRERFIALLPDKAGPDAAAGGSRPSESQRFHQWSNGSIGWWETEASHHKGESPKGTIAIMKIAKVSWDKSCPAGLKATVKYKDDKENFDELVLRFSSKREAEEWSYSLWDFISRLRKSVD